jgi:hypothetical protein
MGATQPVHSGSPVLMTCSELARAASPQITSIVGRINQLWGTSFPVYETVAPEAPHASVGGCVFYNGRVLGNLMTGRLGIRSGQSRDALLWAIFAHEIGHQVHGDLSPARASVANETRELEADRFAGYTLEKLGIEASDLTPFWSMTGDEFGRGQYSHGWSALRTATFIQGWHLAEWGRPEDSEPVTSAMDAPIAPDSADGAPDSP